MPAKAEQLRAKCSDIKHAVKEDFLENARDPVAVPGLMAGGKACVSPMGVDDPLPPLRSRWIMKCQELWVAVDRRHGCGAG